MVSSVVMIVLLKMLIAVALSAGFGALIALSILLWQMLFKDYERVSDIFSALADSFGHFFVATALLLCILTPLMFVLPSP